MLTQKRLKELFSYNEGIGQFIKLQIRGGGVRNQIGDVAGTLTERGKIRIRVDGKSYYAHQLVVLYVTGKMAKGAVIHENGDYTDNRFSNLSFNLSASAKETNPIFIPIPVDIDPIITPTLSEWCGTTYSD